MGRTKGSRNADHLARRRALTEKLLTRLADQTDGPASLRELAQAAGASISTLTHHYGRRDEVVAGVLRDYAAMGEPFRRIAATPSGPLAKSLRDHLLFTLEGQRFGVGRVHVAGLVAGLGQPVLGPVYIQTVLEPSLQAVEERLAAHVARGEMRPVDLRHAALLLVAPLFVALLHQGPLGGAACRPLDPAALVDIQVEAFIRAFGLAPSDQEAR